MISSNNTVLIVDDSVTIRHQVRLILNKQDITVLEASDRNSLKHFISSNQQPIDLFIMDLGLKVDSGMDLMQLIRLTDAYCDTPIIVLTGDSKRDTVLKCTRFNISFYSVKPINASDLSMKVLTALEAHTIKKRSKTTGLFDSNSSNDNDFDLNELDSALKKTHMSKINKLIDGNMSKLKKNK